MAAFGSSGGRRAVARRSGSTVLALALLAAVGVVAEPVAPSVARAQLPDYAGVDPALTAALRDQAVASADSLLSAVTPGAESDTPPTPVAPESDGFTVEPVPQPEVLAELPPVEPVDLPSAPEYEGPEGFVEGESEVVKGSPTSLTYENPDGSFTLVSFASPVVFKDENGEWTQFDSEPVVAGDRVEVPDAKVDTSFGMSGADDLLVSVTQGTRSAGFSLDGAADVLATVTENGVTYPGILPGVDLVENSVIDGVKEELVLHSLPTEAPVYRFRLSMDGLAPQEGPDGSILLVDVWGRTVFTIPRGTAWDTNPNAIEELSRVDVGTELVPDGADWVVELTPNWEWLSSPDRVFPVVIDPQIVSTTSSLWRNDAYVYNAGTTRTYDGTSGGYSQYSSNSGTYVGKVGMPKLNDVWWQLRTYEFFALLIPTDAVYIDSAYLTGRVTYVQEYDGGGGPHPALNNEADFYVFRVTSDWRPGTLSGPVVTWATQPSFDPTPKPGVAHQGQTYAVDITDWVTGWKNGTLANKGFMLGGINKAYIGWGTGYFEQKAMETSDPPTIVVNYTVAPTLTSPADSAEFHKTSTQTVSFSWTEPNGTTSDVVDLCTNQAMTENCTVVSGSPTSASIQAKLLSQNTWYYWRVRMPHTQGALLTSVRKFKLNNSAPVLNLADLSFGDAEVDGFMTTDTPTIALAHAATDADGDAVQYRFTACANADLQTGCLTSDWQDGLSWTADLQWAQKYYWKIEVTDNLPNGQVVGTGPTTTSVNSNLWANEWRFGSGSSARSGNVDLATGNLSFQSTDFDPASVGFDIGVTRTYNSLDVRKSGLFGQGWMSTLDMYVQFDAEGDATVHMADGRSLFFGRESETTFAPSFGAEGTLTTVTGISGVAYALTMPDGLVYRFAIQASGVSKLKSILDPAVSGTDPAAETVHLDWPSGQLVVTDVASGRSVTYALATPTFGEYEHAVSAQASGTSGETWTFVYFEDRLVKACSPDVDPSAVTHKLCTEYQYAANDKVDAVLSPQTKTGTAIAPDPSPTDKKVLFAVEYNLDGQVVRQWVGDNSTDDWQYAYAPHDPSANVTFPDGSTAAVSRMTTTVTTPRGGVTTYDFDANQRVVHQAGPLTAEQWWQYSDKGFLLKATTRLAAGTAAASFATTQYTTNDYGLVTHRNDPNGADWSWTYNQFGRVTKEVDEYGYTVDTAYGTDGLHVTSVTRRAAPTGTTTLAAVGHGDSVRSFTFTDANTLAYGSTTAHPPLWLPASTTDEQGQVTEYRYSAGGDLRWTRTGNATQGYVYTRFTYDSVGRKLTTETSTDDTTWTVVESNQYDPAGRLVVTDGPAVADAVTGDVHQLRVSTVYDDAGNPLTITKSDIGGSAHPDPARVVTYHYDDANRNDRITDALGNTTDKVFDADGNVSETIDARGTRVVITYDLAGRELSTTLKDFVADPVGNPTVKRDVTLSSKTYDLAGHVVSETDALGRVTTTTYDAAGMGWPVKVVLSSGGVPVNVLAATEYDLVGRMKQVLRYGNPTNGTVLQQIATTYDLWGRAHTVTTSDAASNGAGGGTVDRVETNTYNVSGAITETTTTGGSTSFATRYEYLPNGLLASTTTENGSTDLTTSQTYDARGRVVSSTDAAGNVTTATYDVVGRAVSSTAPSVSVVSVDRDAGTASSSTAAATSTVGYNTFGEVAHTRNAAGEVTTTGYDVLGRRSVVTYPAYTPPGGSAVVPSESFAYDAVGNLVASTNRMGETTSFVFDMMNRVVRQTDPVVGSAAAGVSSFTYDDAGNRLSVTNQVGAVTEYTYDAMNQVKETTVYVRRQGGVDANKTTITRDLGGRAISTCLPQVGGQPSCSYATYSPMGEVLSTTDPLGNTTRYAYDGLGRQTSVKDTAGHETVTGYDLAGRVATVTHKGTNGAVVDTTSYTRDLNGNVTHVDLPGGGQFNYSYDTRNRMTAVQQLKTASPVVEWISVSYGYDNLNRQVSTSDGRGNQWLTTYNTLGLTQDQIEPSTPGQETIGDRRFTTVYDAAGLVTEYLQPGGVQVNYSYDELARVVLETAAVTAVSAAGTASFGYDAAGRLTSFSAPQGDVTLTYDDRNLLLSASGEGVASSFAYDALGRMTTRTDAAGESQYLWDVAGRLVADTEPLTNTTRSYTWNSSNQVTGVSYSAGGMQRAYAYDTAGRLESDTLTGDGTTQRQSVYTYDTAGRLTSETISGTASVVGQGVNTYTYDMAGRLASWTAPSATTTTYGWDDNGNRTSNGTVTSTYDARNRLTASSNGDSYTWSARGTMVSQSVGGVISDYSFDGLGRMVTAAGVGVHYDALDRVAERSDGSGGWLAFSYSGLGSQPVSDGTSLIARTPSGKVAAVKTGTAAGVSVVSDRHGDAVGTFNPAAGTVQGSVEFDPFGQVTSTTGVQAGTVGYQGAYTDPTNGLVDMGARWYQPSTGRFTARDTIQPMLGSPISLNMYTYANDDPLGFYDPDGHCAVKIDGNFCAPAKTVKVPTGSGAHASAPATKAHEPTVRCTRGCPDGETQMMPAWTQAPPPDPILVCAANPKCSAKKMVQLIQATKDEGLGAAVFAAIEGADVGGKLDGNWGQKSIDAAADGGPELVEAIMKAFGSRLSGADARRLAQLSQTVARKIQHARSDFEKLDHEKSNFERFTDWAGTTLSAVVSGTVSRLGTLGSYYLDWTKRRMANPLQTIWDDVSGTTIMEQSSALETIVFDDARLYRGGEYCGREAECFLGSDTVGGHGALTIGHTLRFNSHTPPSERFVEHEMVHTYDTENLGGIGFAVAYGAGWVVSAAGCAGSDDFNDCAYENNYWEKRAYEVQRSEDKKPQGIISEHLPDPVRDIGDVFTCSGLLCIS